MTTDQMDAGKTAMRGMIHTQGIAAAAAKAADQYAEPFATAEREQLAGMILAAFEAGQLHGIQTRGL